MADTLTIFCAAFVLGDFVGGGSLFTCTETETERQSAIDKKETVKSEETETDKDRCSKREKRESEKEPF